MIKVARISSWVFLAFAVLILGGGISRGFHLYSAFALLLPFATALMAFYGQPKRWFLGLSMVLNGFYAFGGMFVVAAAVFGKVAQPILVAVACFLGYVVPCTLNIVALRKLWSGARANHQLKPTRRRVQSKKGPGTDI